jgi:hypothetical protein
VRTACFSLVLAVACASTEPPPQAEVSARTVEPAPAEPLQPDPVQPAAKPNVTEIALVCPLGLTPASATDGRREVERSIELRHDFAMVKIRMSGPPDRAHLPAKSASDIESMRQLATAVHATGITPPAGPPVPDGPHCRLRITADGKTIEESVEPTPPSGALADLVVELRKWMHGPEPTWPTAKDPEVAACRREAKLDAKSKFHLREIVIDSDGLRRYEFLDPEDTSTGNHFGCRIKDGKPFILPEG